MGRKCCVTNCNGNYDDANKEKTFRLPRVEEERQRWLAIIPRSNIPKSKDTVVCERHWPEGYPTVLDYGKSRPRDPPSVFSCVKPSLIPTQPPPPRRNVDKLSAASRNLIPDEYDNYIETDTIVDFNNLKDRITTYDFCGIKLQINVSETLIFIQAAEFLDGTGVPKFLLKIDETFKFESFHCGVKSTIMTLSSNRVTLLNRWSYIMEAVNYLNNLEIDNKKTVINQQLLAMGVTTQVGERKYETGTFVRAFEYFALSRSMYRRLRVDFELPSITTLTRLTSKVKSIDDMSFIKHVFSTMDDGRMKRCILVLDEVYVKSTLQYHGGALFGKAVNKPEKTANTALSFMLLCLSGGPKFLCRMLPVKELDANFLFEQTNLIIDGVKNIGGEIIAIICDGNRVNQAFFKRFDTYSDKPWRTKDNIFLLFDYVHLLKNIRNNWITEKSQELVYFYDGEQKVARWDDLKTLLVKESNNLVKMSKLSEVSVYPKPIERQRVSTCLRVFCDRTVSALEVSINSLLSVNKGSII